MRLGAETPLEFWNNSSPGQAKLLKCRCEGGRQQHVVDAILAFQRDTAEVVLGGGRTVSVRDAYSAAGGILGELEMPPVPKALAPHPATFLAMSPENNTIQMDKFVVRVTGIRQVT